MNHLDENKVNTNRKSIGHNVHLDKIAAVSKSIHLGEQRYVV